MMPEPFYAWGQHFAVDLPGALAVFTSRRGGVSEGPYESLNLGHLTDDAPAAVKHNRNALEARLDGSLCFVRQMHGSVVAELDRPTAEAARHAGPERLRRADGQVTVTGGLCPAVLTADCLPVVVAGEGGVAVLHAGWRGLESGILATGVNALRDLGVGGALEAAIGPGAGACCYEVGEEVHAAFAAYPDHVHVGARLDLPAIAREQLTRAGVERIHGLDACTICSDASLFFSHRRDQGITGRQAGLAWLT